MSFGCKFPCAILGLMTVHVITMVTPATVAVFTLRYGLGLFFLFDFTSKLLTCTITTLKCSFSPYHSASKSFVSSHNLSVTLHCSFASSAFSSSICGRLLAISCIGFISAAARSNSFSNSVNDFILY